MDKLQKSMDEFLTPPSRFLQRTDPEPSSAAPVTQRPVAPRPASVETVSRGHSHRENQIPNIQNANVVIYVQSASTLNFNVADQIVPENRL
jgi:hypothetical protein